MKLFLKQSHINYEASIIIDAILVCAILIAWPTRFENAILVPIIGVPLVIILCALAVKNERAVGLYIDGEKIYFKDYFRKKSIAISEIVAIRKAKTVTRRKFGSDREVKGINGEQLYSLVFVTKCVEPGMLREDLSDRDFRILYREYVICFCTYNQPVIDYLLTLNPNIIVF